MLLFLSNLLLRRYFILQADDLLLTFIPAEKKSTHRPKVTIGLPVYNGEKFIHKKLDSILAQTYPEFDLIISDNASTDSTYLICQEYAQKDKRIRVVRQEKNMGLIWNFYFLLRQAKNDYFAWTAVDDVILPEFLEKNMNNLLSKENVVGSISKVDPLILHTDNSKDNRIDSKYTNFRQKLSSSLKTIGIYSLSGPYEKKVRQYLKKSSCQLIYGVFRTEKIQNLSIDKSFLGNDWAFMLRVLESGDFDVVDNVLMYRYGGLSETGIINQAHHINEGIGIIFPYLPFTSWCAKNLGLQMFLKNLDFFIQLNVEGGFVFFLDLTRLFTHKITGK